MSFPEAYPTIVALSSAAGRAGVAVVRVSGPRVRFVFETIAGSVPQPRHATLRHLRDGSGGIIDSALLLFFPGPASFTGEDVAEFQVHGSRAVLARLLSTLTALPGVRLAEAGEFTRRAFEAGKLDLAAVEGLADLIDSETEWQRRQALRQMEGALGDLAAAWRQRLIEAMALLAADIDFSDEGDVSGGVVAEAMTLVAQVMAELRRALGSFATGERVRDGFVVVLAGPPNAGKSSLLNSLAQRDVAIVSPTAGTTRDAIEVRLDLGGLPVILIDTAGLRDGAADAVEVEGMRRARALVGRADLVLGLRAVDSDPDRIPLGENVIAVATKCDLTGAARPGELPVSVVTGAGLDALLAAIVKRIGVTAGSEPALLTRERHRVAVSDALVALERATVSDGQAELAAEDVRLAVQALERLVGRVDVEDVLDQLFSGFCIGK